MVMTKPSINPVYAIENQEVIQKLKEAGYSEIVDCLLDNEKDCYTKKGRLNKSSTCRKLNWKGKKLEDALEQMRIILAAEYNLDIEEIEEGEEQED
jgi:hypothetical protein